MPNPAGRPKGSPNKATKSVREAIAEFAQQNVGNMGVWLAEIADPAKRLELYMRALEFHVPKLGRTEITGEGGKDLTLTIGKADADLL